MGTQTGANAQITHLYHSTSSQQIQAVLVVVALQEGRVENKRLNINMINLGNIYTNICNSYKPKHLGYMLSNDFIVVYHNSEQKTLQIN